MVKREPKRLKTRWQPRRELSHTCRAASPSPRAVPAKPGQGTSVSAPWLSIRAFSQVYPEDCYFLSLKYITLFVAGDPWVLFKTIGCPAACRRCNTLFFPVLLGESETSFTPLGESFPPPFTCLLLRILVTPRKLCFLTAVSSVCVCVCVSKRSIHRSLILCYLFLPAWRGGTQGKTSKGRNPRDAQQLKSAGAARFSISQGLSRAGVKTLLYQEGRSWLKPPGEGQSGQKWQCQVARVVSAARLLPAEPRLQGLRAPVPNQPTAENEQLRCTVIPLQRPVSAQANLNLDPRTKQPIAAGSGVVGSWLCKRCEK